MKTMKTWKIGIHQIHESMKPRESRKFRNIMRPTKSSISRSHYVCVLLHLRISISAELYFHRGSTYLYVLCYLLSTSVVMCRFVLFYFVLFCVLSYVPFCYILLRSLFTTMYITKCVLVCYVLLTT
ncbi:hypothetical protein J3R30DRAFT_141900 [Lentinula aciculospora]|uniref:Uncharacterized protein n=1 Tax=Lentinula aciculospora TaxID=153920 RepID=A0A9W9AUG9_9AGAR|nr:hypothetical protein J3R30DRAFT_141900 [Lentinula aciculospora]